MRFYACTLLLIVTALAVSACGFRPLYGEGATVSDAARTRLGAVEIGTIPDQPGQYLHNALTDRFYTHGRPEAPRYALSLSPVQENRTNLDVTKTSGTTRAQLRLTTQMVLKDSDGAVLLERSLMAITSYNVLQSQFTTHVAEESARRNALDDLARQVETQMLLYFNR